MTADISPVVKAVETAKTLHGGTFAHRLPWSCLCGAIFRSVEDHHEHYRTEVAKAAMDAARPIIDAEAYARGWADATEVVEFQGQKVYRHQVMEMLPPNWADELTDIDDRPPIDVAPARIETGDTLPTMPEMHIGFRPEESP